MYRNQGNAPVGVAVAQASTARGAIHGFDSRSRSFGLTLEDRTDRGLIVRVDDHTTYTLDGELSTMESALQDGHSATVTHRGQLALNVEARSVESSAIL